MKKTFLFILLSTFSIACSPESPLSVNSAELPITNGIEHFGHAFVGKLIFDLTGNQTQDGICTATLVGNETVLTAAHCLSYPNLNFVIDGLAYNVDKVIPHPDYDPQINPYLNDIGLVKLQTPPSSPGSKIWPDAPMFQTQVTLVGFGKTAWDADDIGIKRIASNTINMIYPSYFSIVGTGGAIGNACSGDSGGPVFLVEKGEEAIVGIISIPIPEGTCGVETYNTRVDPYVSWLLDQSNGDISFHDIKPPNIFIDSPSDGSNVGLDIDLNVRASDNVAITSVVTYVNDIEQSLLFTPPYVFKLHLEHGINSIDVIAKDNANNEAFSSIKVNAMAHLDSDFNTYNDLSINQIDKGLLPVDSGIHQEIPSKDGHISDVGCDCDIGYYPSNLELKENIFIIGIIIIVGAVFRKQRSKTNIIQEIITAISRKSNCLLKPKQRIDI